MAKLSLRNVGKTYYPAVEAVRDFNLEIEDKEFVVFVGPSGCGKSTVLRMIAGLEDITAGEVYIGEKLVNNIPAKNRDISMVFQNYALYPHLSAYKNMSFGLEIRKTDKKEIEERVSRIAALLGISHLLDRKPGQMSGGEKQRVAIGRAIIRNPQVFLFDEPLSNLDAKLKFGMRKELIKLHKEIDTTFIYVTHDQIEAMTMADKIVVMNDGVIQQAGTPKEIFNYPANMFVAGFIGTPQMNFIKCEIIENNGFWVKMGDNEISLKDSSISKEVLTDIVGKEITMGIRPNHMRMAGDIEGESILKNVQVDLVENTGTEQYIYATMGDILITICSKDGIEADGLVDVVVEADKIMLFDENGTAL